VRKYWHDIGVYAPISKIVTNLVLSCVVSCAVLPCVVFLGLVCFVLSHLLYGCAVRSSCVMARSPLSAFPLPIQDQEKTPCLEMESSCVNNLGSGFYNTTSGQQKTTGVFLEFS
jgi:hypothetical protein